MVDVLESWPGHALRPRGLLIERSMGSVAVVAIDVLVDQSSEMATAEDEHPVETLATDCRRNARRPHWHEGPGSERSEFPLSRIPSRSCL